MFFDHQKLEALKRKCDLSFLQIVKAIIKKIHFFSLYQLYEKVEMNILKTNQYKEEIQQLRDLVVK